MKSNYTQRFKDAPWIVKQSETVLIGGAGGISSWVVLLLSRMNAQDTLQLEVFDFDTIEEHNIGGQFYRPSQIGEYKATALKKNVEMFTDTKSIKDNIGEYNSQTIGHHLCITGFDNMAARKTMFLNWKKAIPYFTNNDFKNIKPIFIDGRLTADNIQIFCVTPENMSEYENNYLFSDSEVEDAPCTFKQTSYLAAIIGGLMVNCFLNHIQNSYNTNVTFTVPFKTEFYAPLMLLS